MINGQTQTGSPTIDYFLSKINAYQNDSDQSEQKIEDVPRDDKAENEYFQNSIKNIDMSELEHQAGREEEGLMSTGETLGEYLKRTGARTAARIAETPIEIAKGMSELPENLMQGPVGQKIAKTLKQSSGIAQYLPGKEQIRDFERKHTGEYLQPQTPGEERYDEFVQDVTGQMMGFGRAGREIKSAVTGVQALRNIGQRVGRATAVAGVGAGTKEIAKDLGFGETAQEWSKMGSMLIASMVEPHGARNYVNRLYDQAGRSLPAGASGDARLLERQLTNTWDRVTRGLGSPDETAVQTAVERLIDKISNGQLTYEEAVASKRSLNTMMMNTVYGTADRAAQARARNLFQGMNANLNEFIGQAEAQYPEFVAAQRAADSGFGAIEQGRRLRNFVRDNKKGVIAMGILPAVEEMLHGEGFTSGVGKAVRGTAKAAAFTYPALKTYEITQRILRSPTMRHYYLNALEAGLAENSSSMLKNLKKLQGHMQKEPEFAELFKNVETNKSKEED